MATNHSKVIFGLPTGGGFYGPLTYNKKVRYPTISLAPSQTYKKEVEQLQKYLVSQGYMTQAEMNLGPGYYGPKTTAAVAKLQTKLGVDTAGYPGYWGPKTLAKLQATPTAPKSLYEAPGYIGPKPTDFGKIAPAPEGIGEMGTWINPTTGKGYSGPKKEATDIPASSTTGQPITPVAPVAPVAPVHQLLLRQ